MVAFNFFIYLLKYTSVHTYENAYYFRSAVVVCFFSFTRWIGRIHPGKLVYSLMKGVCLKRRLFFFPFLLHIVCLTPLVLCQFLRAGCTPLSDPRSIYVAYLLASSSLYLIACGRNVFCFIFVFLNVHAEFSSCNDPDVLHECTRRPNRP